MPPRRITHTILLWRDLPSASTCGRRLQQWEEDGVRLEVWRAFLQELSEARKLDWGEAFIDASFAPAKRGLGVGKTKRGKGTKWMVVVDGAGVPLGSHLTSASPAEVTLVAPVIERLLLPHRPWRLIADRAYDSDPLRRWPAAQHIELVCPHRRGRTRPSTQDGRALRRYRLVLGDIPVAGQIRFVPARRQRVQVLLGVWADAEHGAAIQGTSSAFGNVAASGDHQTPIHAQLLTSRLASDT